MDNTEYYRRQAQECRRLLGLAQSEAAAQVLRNLSHSWVRIANQADLYAEIVRREDRSEKSTASSFGCLLESPPRRSALANDSPAVTLPQGKENAPSLGRAEAAWGALLE